MQESHTTAGGWEIGGWGWGDTNDLVVVSAEKAMWIQERQLMALRLLGQFVILKGGLYFETGLTACVTQLTQLSPPHHRSDLVRLPKIVTLRRQCCR